VKRTRSSKSSPGQRLEGTRKDYLTEHPTVPPLIVDDLGMLKLAHTTAEDVLELIVRRLRTRLHAPHVESTVDDWGKLLCDTAEVTAPLDRVLHHANVLTCGRWSWRTRVQTGLRADEGTK
jgi:DNA replication protein DnaC